MSSVVSNLETSRHCGWGGQGFRRSTVFWWLED